MDELLDLGVDGLITDRTDVLKEVLIRRGQWRDHHERPAPLGHRGPRPPSTGCQAAAGLVLVRLGQLGLRHDGRCGALRAVHDLRRRAGPPAATDGDETCDKTVNLLGLHLAAGSLPFYLISFATISQRVRPARRRRDRGPLGAQEVAHGAASRGPGALRGAAVLHARARTGSSAPSRVGAEQHPRRLLAGGLRRDPGATSRPRTSATGSPRGAGPWATSAAACCSRSTSVVYSCTTRSGSARRWPCGSRCSPPALWWAGFTIIPFVRLRNHAPVNVARRDGRLCPAQLRPAVRHAPGACAATR